jgi:hypothetical protein
MNDPIAPVSDTHDTATALAGIPAMRRAVLMDVFATMDAGDLDGMVSGDGAIRSPRRNGHRYQGDRLETVPLCRHRMTKRGGDGIGLGGGCELGRRPEVVWGVRRPCRISRVGSGNDNGVTPQQATVAKRVGAFVGGGDARGDCGLRQRCV